MPKSSAERKAAQRARQAAAGGKKLELVLDNQELEMLTQNCAARRPGREPYELNEYITILIRKDAAELAQQLEALAKQEPEIYEAEINGVMSSVTKSHYEDCKRYGVKVRELFTRAVPPAPFVVKAPEFKVHAQHPTMAAGMRDNDWKETIKAAGGSVENDK